MKRLPLELKQEIVLYLDFLKCVEIFPKIAYHIYAIKPNKWEWCIKNGKILVGLARDYNIDLAAQHGYLKAVKWLHQNHIEGCTTAAMDSAAKNGHYML